MRFFALVGALVIAVGLVMYWHRREPSVDCARYGLDSGKWKVERTRLKLDTETDGERFARQAARHLVRCHSLQGLTRRQIRARLGKPDYRARDNQPRPHTEYGYVVGYSPGRGSDVEDSLFIEFDKGKVVYGSAPTRGRGCCNEDLKDGAPVGGGP
jgi:hypothetical protein